ncbi:MAG: two-component sensor histidine kinase [Chloroflexi bacterium]|nr:two-component sensor histidine kinase [Chloroflexota bacterium]
MRLRLFLSFVFIVLVSIVSVVVIAGQGAARVVQTFMFRGNTSQVEQLVQNLEAYYSANGSWQGVETIVPSPQPATQQPTPLLTGTPAQNVPVTSVPRTSILATKTPATGSRVTVKGTSKSTLKGTPKATPNQRIRLLDKSGKVVLDTGGTKATPRPAPAEQQPTRALLSPSGETVGYLTMSGSVSLSSDESNFLINRLNRSAIIAGLIAGAIAILLALLLANRLIQPVQVLTKATARMAQGDLSQRVDVHGKDELAYLGQTFNQMAGSLQQAQASRKAMTADIAHELRNPLAVQRAHLEALQDGLYPSTPENLQPILDQNILLSRLVEDLRTLALADAGQLSLERTPTDVMELLQRIAERFTPPAALCDIALSVQQTEDIKSNPPVLNLDPARLEQILGNLLSNALRYTPDGGKIILRMSRVNGAVQISISDNGPGIPEQELPHIFERFYRADRSRSRSEGGSGLGLTIARQLAEAHGGSLTAANAPDGGAVFTLSLPDVAGSI